MICWISWFFRTRRCEIAKGQKLQIAVKQTQRKRIKFVLSGKSQTQSNSWAISPLQGPSGLRCRPCHCFAGALVTAAVGYKEVCRGVPRQPCNYALCHQDCSLGIDKGRCTQIQGEIAVRGLFSMQKHGSWLSWKSTIQFGLVEGRH